VKETQRAARDPLPTTADAVAASVAVGRRLGLAVEDPFVIADGYSVRVRLGPAVTRVLTRGRILRGEALPWLSREVDVVSWLTAAGASVIPTWSPAGPFIAGDLEVTLWAWSEHTGNTIGQAAYGALLGELHAVLDHYDGDLPTLAGPITDVTSALAISDDPVLHEAAADLLPLAVTWPRRPLHGDAHTGNVLLTPDGPRWTDFEDVCGGPVEWDLASTTVTDEAVAAYPGPVDRARLSDCRDLRRLQILAGVLTDDIQNPDLYDELVEALRRRLA
jgi:phosphotransferase family enzyme